MSFAAGIAIIQSPKRLGGTPVLILLVMVFNPPVKVEIQSSIELAGQEVFVVIELVVDNDRLAQG